MLKAFAEWLSDRNYLNRIDIDYDYDENPIENIYSLSVNEVLEEYQERSYQEQTPEEYVKNWCDANFYTLVAKDVWEDLRILNCKDTISREAIKQVYKQEMQNNLKDPQKCIDFSDLAEDFYQSFCEFIDKVPLPEQYSHSQYWIKHRWNCWECPVCHNENGLYSNRASAYCPDCGIKLEKKDVINESGK